MDSNLRALPSVDRLTSDARLRELEQDYPHSLLVDLARRYLDEVRSDVALGQPPPPFERLVESVRGRVQTLGEPSLRPVINATGVVLHTNVGRAPLSEDALAAMERASRGYTNLELDLDSGRRGSRQVHVEQLLCQVTGAEAALVVNNNASAVLLALTALAKRKEVIVSRGEAVEIGGGFRIPEVLRQSGAKLVEVGTTNRTYLSDYEAAITPRTTALLRVHTSNFQVTGFVSSVDLGDLAALAGRRGLTVIHDLGSGCLLETTQFGLGPEPLVQESVALGAGLVCFSGDKLLGGPQAGIVTGRRELVDHLRRHPLARAVRIDKGRLAGLAATLVHYVKGEALTKVPVWRMISTPLPELEVRARRWAQALGGAAEVVAGESTIGGGSLPGSTLPTRLVAIRGKRGRSVAELARLLRLGQPPVVARIEKDTLFLDPRTVLPNEEEALVQAVARALGRAQQ